MPKLFNNPDLFSPHLAALRAEGQRIGIVPTMGALHEGHLALVKAAKAACDVVVVSIFVNPLQFAANEDLSRYPRPLEDDLRLLEEVGADVVFTPAPDAMYPEGFATHISVTGVSEGLCGAVRPGHFDGVATVVAKLLLLSSATDAWFGKKDFQQLKVIERMVTDLSLPIRIHAAPIVREADGVAMSSRNRYLSEAERAIAPQLYQALQLVRASLLAGEALDQTITRALDTLREAGFDSVDYLELRDSRSLALLPCYQPPCQLLVAARLGKTRLIDNIEVGA